MEISSLVFSLYLTLDDDQDGGWVFLLVPARLGSPGQTAIKRLLLLLFSLYIGSGTESLECIIQVILMVRMASLPVTCHSVVAVKETKGTDSVEKRPHPFFIHHLTPEHWTSSEK